MTGNITVVIDYAGKINNKMAGLYRTRHMRDHTEQGAAVTQFEKSDARRAFPCFDHPAGKQSFLLKDNSPR